MEDKIPKIANQIPSILFCIILKSEIMPNINPIKGLNGSNKKTITGNRLTKMNRGSKELEIKIG